MVVIFGASRLPLIGKGLGEGIKNFRTGMKDPPEIDVTPPSSQGPGDEAEKTE